MKKKLMLLPFATLFLCAPDGPSSCSTEPTTDQVQRLAQEKTIQEANAQVGMHF
jgi:hypothetical protein